LFLTVKHQTIRLCHNPRQRASLGSAQKTGQAQGRDAATASLANERGGGEQQELRIPGGTGSRSTRPRGRGSALPAGSGCGAASPPRPELTDPPASRLGILCTKVGSCPKPAAHGVHQQPRTPAHCCTWISRFTPSHALTPCRPHSSRGNGEQAAVPTSGLQPPPVAYQSPHF